jgi:Family of unknown function (DUF6152)
MKAKHAMLTLAALSTLLGAITVQAHHGRASYSNEIVTLQATVTEFRFVNPHVQVYFDITNDAGQVEHWQGELTAPNKLARAGWTKTTFKPGDHLQITGRAARNDGHSVAINEILTAEGKSLPLFENLD